MARPRVIDPMVVVQGFREGKFRFGADAAREFKCSRVRINQILNEYAPDLLPGKEKPVVAADQRALAARQKKMRSATERALKDFPTLSTAAGSLGLTESGLTSRMRRLGIEKPRIVAES